MSVSKRKKINREMALAELARCFGEDRAAVVARGLMSHVYLVVAHNQQTGEDGTTVYLTLLAGLMRIFGDFIHDDIRDFVEWGHTPPFTVEQATALAERRNVDELIDKLDEWNNFVWELGGDRGWTYEVVSAPVLLEGERDTEPANEPE